MHIRVFQDCYGDTDGGFKFKLGEEPKTSVKIGTLLITLGFAEEIKPKADEVVEVKAAAKAEEKAK